MSAACATVALSSTAAPKPKITELTTPFTAQSPLKMDGRHAHACRLRQFIIRELGSMRCVWSVQLTRDVIEERNAHQQHQQRDAHLLAEHLRALGQGQIA